ncbi:MAG: hypothetical protein D3923_01190 [Candidatus Electrothrix sp. AR3]|nr:hypothetical protein [Candidatus Electrothrix sp. AR3]
MFFLICKLIINNTSEAFDVKGGIFCLKIIKIKLPTVLLYFFKIVQLCWVFFTNGKVLKREG